MTARKFPELAAATIILCGGFALGAHTTNQPTYKKDHKLISSLVTANDEMHGYCKGYASLEAKSDGSTELVGSCPYGGSDPLLLGDAKDYLKKTR